LRAIFVPFCDGDQQRKRLTFDKQNRQYVKLLGTHGARIFEYFLFLKGRTFYFGDYIWQG
jgi:hypothetical protein